jgi:thiosulfate/3-mercaptopyruvate sulfurtransferase
MTSLSLPPLVSPDWLAAQLRQPELVILDTSWYLPLLGRDVQVEYRASHLPGAVRFDLDAASAADTTLPHMLPSAEAFARYVGGLGLGNDSVVVVYDSSGANLSAARAWWMFRVFGHDAVTILDGGLGRWRREGRALMRGEVSRPPRVFTARLRPDRVIDREGVRRALLEQSRLVVDVRSAGRFTAQEPEPRPGLPSGHMPGAVNLPYTELVEADGTALPLVLLEERLRRVGLGPDRLAVASCGSGVTACNLVLALDRLGWAWPLVYDGSWTEWVSTGMPVVGVESGDR